MSWPFPFYLSQGSSVGGRVTYLTQKGGFLLLYQHHPPSAGDGRLGQLNPNAGVRLSFAVLALRPPKTDLPLRGQEVLHLAQMSKKTIVPETQVFLLFKSSSNLTSHPQENDGKT